jgi:hypothetical protein
MEQTDLPAKVASNDLLGPLPRKTVHEDEVWRIEFHTDTSMETERQRCYELGLSGERKQHAKTQETYEWSLIELPRDKDGIGLVACSGTAAEQDDAEREAAQYASQYAQDEPIEVHVFRVERRELVKYQIQRQKRA